MRIIFLTILTVALFGVAFFFERYHASEDGLKHYITQIEKGLHQQETEVEQLAEVLQTEWSKQADFDYNSFLLQQNLSSKPYNVLLFGADSLLFWGNHKIIVSLDSANGVRQLENGFYFVKKKILFGDKSLLAIIPLKQQYQLDADFKRESNYLPNGFGEMGEATPLLSITTQEITNFAIRNLSGEPCCFVKYEQKGYLSSAAQYELIVYYFLAFIFLAYLVNSLSLILMRGKYARFGIVFFILAVFGIKYLSFSLDLTHTLGAIPLFTEYLTSNLILNKTPGSMFINIMLILWVIMFYYKNVPISKLGHYLPFAWRISIAIALYVLVICGIFMTIDMHREIIQSPNLAFAFDNFFYIEPSSVLTIFCLLLIWFALFLFNYKAIANIFSLGFDQRMRTIIIAALLVLVFGMLNYRNILVINPLIVVIFCFLYIILLDVFYENKIGSYLSWFLTWIGIFALSTTLLLYTYKRDTDLELLSTALNQMANDKDSIAEEQLQTLANEIQANTDSLNDRKELLNFIHQRTKRKEYLSDHYNLALSDTTIFARNNKVRSSPDSDGVMNYIAQVPITTIDGNLEYYQLEAYPINETPNQSYASSLFKVPYLKIKDFSRINFAIFDKNGILLDSKGNYSRKDFPEQLPYLGKYKDIISTTQTEYILRTEQGKVLVGKIVYGSIFKIIFPFTYILIFLFGISSFIITINTFTNGIDKFFVLPRGSSLQLRVQRSVIGLIAFVSIFTIGATILFVQTIFEKDYSSQFSQNTNIIHHNILNDLKYQENAALELSKVVAPISKSHQIDILLYDLSGKMLNPQGKKIYEKGILSQQMNPEALFKLKNLNDWQCILDESIEEFNFKAAYGKIIKNDKTIAYFSIPFYGKELERRNSMSETIGALVSIYIVLLIPFIIFTFMVADNLMDPIREIGHKLGLIKLGQKTLDVEWKGKDALGDLIHEFNEMLSNFDKEAKAEQQTAKDEAWRMMARQVAHDIRNVLTPMKLSIQFLEHTTQNAEDSVKERVSRIAGTIVEQIHNFNQIATNFSDYSKAETQANAIEETNLNEFVSRNCELFLNEIDSRIAIIVNLPKEQFTVKMDKAQMSRVITNLITNAKQAIPDNRDGRIDIHLSQKEQNALIRVSDNGFGIPIEQMEQIFQPNFTTKNSGSGLGLAICRRLVEDIQGKIYCTSILEQGSVFYIELPIVEIIEIEEENKEI